MGGARLAARHVAVALADCELAASHRRVFAADQEITDPAYHRVLEHLRLARYRGGSPIGAWGRLPAPCTQVHLSKVALEAAGVACAASRRLPSPG
jgi:hypothetical protein